MSYQSKNTPVETLIRLYQTALDAANPLKVLPAFLPKAHDGRTVVVGLGKAAASMAMAVETHWTGELEGVVVVPHGASLPLKKIRICEGSHPVPDIQSVLAAEQLMHAVGGLTENDLVIALISGGGSALCCMPAQGLSLEDKQHLTRELLKRGATIAEINTVRRHLSAIKGGKLAIRAYPARVLTLLISDIPGDDPALIASGPTLPDSSTCADALAVLQRYGIDKQSTVVSALSRGDWESAKPDDPRLSQNTHHIIASAWNGLQAAAQYAQNCGVSCHILSDAMEGESRDLAKAHAAIALSIVQRGVPFNAPCVLISGGEATVTLRGDGRGGRNTEFALALGLALEGQKGAERIFALSAGTDGLDGSARAAGAWITPSTVSQARNFGLNPQQELDANNSATVMERVGSLVHTGPTFTNINDFRAIYIEA